MLLLHIMSYETWNNRWSEWSKIEVLCLWLRHLDKIYWTNGQVITFLILEPLTTFTLWVTMMRFSARVSASSCRTDWSTSANCAWPTSSSPSAPCFFKMSPSRANSAQTIIQLFNFMKQRMPFCNQDLETGLLLHLNVQSFASISSKPVNRLQESIFFFIIASKGPSIGWKNYKQETGEGRLRSSVAFIVESHLTMHKNGADGELK